MNSNPPLYHPPLVRQTHKKCEYTNCLIFVSDYDHSYCYKHASKKELMFHKRNKHVMEVAKHHHWGFKYLS